MKVWKWTALVVSGGLLMQFASCATDLLYYVMQVAASQAISGALGAAAST